MSVMPYGQRQQETLTTHWVDIDGEWRWIFRDVGAIQEGGCPTA